MATRRIPLIPPPPFSVKPEQGDSERSSVENRDAKRREDLKSPRHGAYRGKSSGEFERVGPHAGMDINALVAEAEGWISRLTEGDNYRRLLELAVLRRDSVLLDGLLKALHRR